MYCALGMLHGIHNFAVLYESTQKMNKTIKSIIMGVAAIVGLASCNSSDPGDYVTEQTLSSCFAYSSTPGVDSNMATSVSYYIKLNYTLKTAEVSISNFELSDGVTYPKMTFTDIPFTIEPYGWKKISGTMLTPTIAGFGNVPLFSSFEIKLLDRYYGTSMYIPAFTANFLVNNSVAVFSSLPVQLLAGTTESTAPSNDVFKTTSSIYVVDMDFKKMKANIDITGAQFAEKMPALDISFKDIPFVLSGQKVILSAESLTPYMGSTPQPDYPISDLVAEYDFAKGMTLSFGCTVGGALYHVTFDGPLEVEE